MPQYILDMLDEKGYCPSLHSAIEERDGESSIFRYMTRRTERAFWTRRNTLT